MTLNPSPTRHTAGNERPKPGTTNDALDSRRWHVNKAERDDLPDLPLFDADAHGRPAIGGMMTMTGKRAAEQFVNETIKVSRNQPTQRGELALALVESAGAIMVEDALDHPERRAIYLRAAEMLAEHLSARLPIEASVDADATRH